MTDSKSIINIDAKDLSKVGVALIEKISDAVGGLYRPHQIVRLAKAQAKADIITEKTQIELDTLRHRALDRFVAEEVKKQSNIEGIIRRTIPMLEEKAEPNNIEDDWVSNFFDKCRIISDNEMQQLWSKILAGEVNAPGRFSKRTINLLADLDKNDAEIFRKLCRYCWNITKITPLIFDEKENIYRKNGIKFESIFHLEALNLIQFSDKGYRRIGVQDNLEISYYGRNLKLEKRKEAQGNFSVGRVRLTNAGQQLAEICEGEPVKDFYEYVARNFNKRKIYSVIEEI